jgi:hypothetical protein
MSEQNRFRITPRDEAIFDFDAADNVEPPRRIARRIAMKYDCGNTHPIVDEISHAIEDAMLLGSRRPR